MRRFVYQFVRTSVRFGVICAAGLLLLASFFVWIPRTMLRFLRACAAVFCLFAAVSILNVFLFGRRFFGR